MQPPDLDSLRLQRLNHLGPGRLLCEADNDDSSSSSRSHSGEDEVLKAVTTPS